VGSEIPKACSQRLAPWQQATIEIMLAISLTIACSRYIYWCYSSRISCSWWITQSTQHRRRGCNSSNPIFILSWPRQWGWLDVPHFFEDFLRQKFLQPDALSIANLYYKSGNWPVSCLLQQTGRLLYYSQPGRAW